MLQPSLRLFVPTNQHRHGQAVSLFVMFAALVAWIIRVVVTGKDEL